MRVNRFRDTGGYKVNMSLQEGKTVTEGMVQTTERERTKDSYMHVAVILLVLASASVLRVVHDLDTATLSTVYGASLGYATGLANKARNGYSK